ncbi:hypothetical protein IAT38_000915 [Cryptococcus sp. DSM 104549]
MVDYSPPGSRHRAAAASYRTPRNSHADILLSSDKDTSPEGPSTPPSRPSQPIQESGNPVLDELLLITSATDVFQEEETGAGRGAGLGTPSTPRRKLSKGSMTSTKRIQSPVNTSPKISRISRSPVGSKKVQYLGDKPHKQAGKQSPSIRHSHSASTLKERSSGSPSRRLHGAISSQVELAAFRRALREEARQELATFQQTLASEAQKEANALSTRLEDVESKLKATEAKLVKARKETAAVKSEFDLYREQHTEALKNYTKLIRGEISKLQEDVSAIYNREALEKEGDCVEAFAKFMWNTLRDAIPPSSDLSLDSATDSFVLDQPDQLTNGDSLSSFDESYDDTAVRASGPHSGYWAMPCADRDAFGHARAKILSGSLPANARTRVSTRARYPHLHHDCHRVLLNSLDTERPLLFEHLFEGGGPEVLFYHHPFDQRRLADLSDPVTLLDYLLRLDRVAVCGYPDRVTSRLMCAPREDRVRQMLAAMGPQCATEAILALRADPASPCIPFTQIQSLQEYFGEQGFDILKERDAAGCCPEDHEIELCG